MATAEEILSAMTAEETQQVLVIDNDLRTIAIPEGVALLGVTSDEDVRRLHFAMPRMCGEFDLSAFALRINYLNAGNEGDVYPVADAETDGDTIRFSWLVGRHACKYKGNVTFIVCGKLVGDGGEVEKEYNTTVATLPVLEGLETGEAIVQAHPDVIEAILRRLDTLEQEGGGVSAEAIAAAVEAYLTEHPAAGEDGGYYAPSVDGDGNLTWTPSKEGMPGVTGANIRGPEGAPGADGKDGSSVTHSWIGTTLSVTSASGTSSSDLKGDKGEKGEKGDKGDKGETGEPGADGMPGTPGADGEDGGYYAPSVDGEGNLTWTASKEGMPDIPGANIKGPAGSGGSGSAYELPIASATQLGGVQPTVKTDEMTQAVGVDDAGGLWTAPGTVGNTDAWELLLDVTTEEVVHRIGCTPKKKYEEYYMYIKANAWNKADDAANGTAAFGQLQFSTYGNPNMMVNTLVYTGTAGKFVESGCLVKKYGDVYRMLAFGNNGNNGLPGTVYTNNGFRSDSPTEVTDLYVIAANNTTTQFAVGSVCKIWGRHAL